MEANRLAPPRPVILQHTPCLRNSELSFSSLKKQDQSRCQRNKEFNHTLNRVRFSFHGLGLISSLPFIDGRGPLVT